ncbi:MAG: TRAP transporter small permease subunit [Paracoccaceae bacterium]
MSDREKTARRAPLFAVDRLLADVAGAALFAMMLLTVVSIAGRFLFSMPIPDVEAIDEMLLVAVVFLPLAYTQARREHVEVTLFTDRLSPRAIRRFVWLGCFVGAVAFAVLAYAMGWGAQRAWVTGDAYLGINQIVTWPARVVAVVGLVALILRLTLDLTIARRRAQEDFAATITTPENKE